MDYNLKFSQCLIEAAQSFVDKDEGNDEAGRAVLCLSLLSCELSLKAILEKAGYSVKELKKRSHNFFGLIEDLCRCDLQKTGIAGSKPFSGARFLSQIVAPEYGNGTVGTLLKGEDSGDSKYSNEIRYGELVRHFPPILMLKCAAKIIEWAREHFDEIKRRTA